MILLLNSVGYGDICPSEDCPIEGKFFIVFISFIGLGLFCGPLLSVTSSWRHSIPGGMVSLTSVTLAMGTCLFSMTEQVSTLEALYASIITGTTIGYGDLTPRTDLGKVAVALYALLVVNVIGALLEGVKEYLITFCMLPATVSPTVGVASTTTEAVEAKVAVMVGGSSRKGNKDL